MVKTPRIITLMFHRIDDAANGLSPKKFQQYFQYLIENFPIVGPGDPLNHEPLSVCLTFDDAYYDFYHHVFPLLEQHKTKALLAVPVKYIQEDTQASSLHRLQTPGGCDFTDHAHTDRVPLCTWRELQTMAKSPNVIMASHSFAHLDLRKPGINIQQEIIDSKHELENRLQIPIRHFVYPFGRFNRQVHQTVRHHYDYGLRIGSAINRGWDQKNQLIYRVDAEHYWMNVRPFSAWSVGKMSVKYWSNRLRFR